MLAEHLRQGPLGEGEGPAEQGRRCGHSMVRLTGSTGSRGAAVKPVTHATAARVEDHWAELTSPQELEALRTSLLRLLTELRTQ
jgi:hypothetical protein